MLFRSLEAARQELNRLDAEVARFKMENFGRLPEHFDANVAQLHSYQTMLSAANEALSHLQQQRLMLETQIQNNNTNISYYRSLTEGQPTPDGSGTVRQLQLRQLQQRIENLRSEIAALTEQLTPNHPAIKRAQASLAALERRHEESQQEGVNPQASRAMRDLTAANNVLQTEMQNLTLQMAEKVKQIQDLNRMIASYQSTIESSPRVEQQYEKLLRDQGLARQQVEEKLKEGPVTL